MCGLGMRKLEKTSESGISRGESGKMRDAEGDGRSALQVNPKSAPEHEKVFYHDNFKHSLCLRRPPADSLHGRFAKGEMSAEPQLPSFVWNVGLMAK